ncbi:hypothetical protein GCM10011583_08040 [Streptomyces camponoticapitis]|uniref:Uncharacterized protein n=1 Tax=Streptomyces camponoticapitis TaxID=1616125 RepID=A0ABQ2DYC1_9ACTN|nr:hypothetical protein GCM10011583_08040 [Streptomyces camponoticapitis]
MSIRPDQGVPAPVAADVSLARATDDNAASARSRDREPGRIGKTTPRAWLSDQAGSESEVWCRASQGEGRSRRGASATDDNAERCGTRDHEPGRIREPGSEGARTAALAGGRTG